MRVTVWLFGCELVAVHIGPPDADRDGDVGSYPVGFTYDHEGG